MKKNKRNRKGRCNGYWEEYFPNGNLYYRGNFIDGKEEGFCENYHDNGQLWRKGNYKNANPEGLWEYYNKNGVLILIEYNLVD
jgi:antitoxin component YwqK of YwqJK toxin-antitoxin module